jgi:AraC-like DNA-binding protein
LDLILDGLMAEFLASNPDDEFAMKRRRSWMYPIITKILGTVSAPVPGGSAMESTTEPSLRRERVVSKIIRYIDANIEGDLAMERIEAVAGLSGRQIHRLFMEVTGKSCHGYMLDRRLEIARSKLQADPALSIKEVAHASGFASAAHFSAKFKIHFGVTPTEYR